jgi:hypothetical protein
LPYVLIPPGWANAAQATAAHAKAGAKTFRQIDLRNPDRTLTACSKQPTMRLSESQNKRMQEGKRLGEPREIAAGEMLTVVFDGPAPARLAP